MLENTEGAIKKEQSSETGNIGNTRHRTNKCQKIPKGQSKKNNPVKLATQGTQDDVNQNKNTTQFVLNTTIRNLTQIT